MAKRREAVARGWWRLSGDTGAGERFARDFARAGFFLKPFCFYAPIFFENGFLYGPVAQAGKRAENRENSGGGGRSKN